MSKRGFGLLLVLLFFSLSLSGCYYFSAKKEIGNAQALLDQFKSAGGPAKAPYEYCTAEKLLDVSRGEFDENDYKHSVEFAVRSKTASQAGLAEMNKQK